MADITTWVPGLLTPVLGFVGQRLVQPGPGRLESRVNHHVDLLAKTPDALAGPLRKLVASELEALRIHNEDKLNRKLDGGAVATVLLFVIVGTIAPILLWGLDRWWWRAIAVTLALICATFVAVGLTQLYTTDDKTSKT